MNAPVRIPAPRDLAFKLAPERTKAAAVTLLHGLAELRYGGDPTELVDEVADVLCARLDPTERGWLLMTAAKAAEPANLDALAVAVVESAGPPLPTLSDIRAEARDWAAWASGAELRAYLAACWHRLPDKDRATFLKAARKVTA